MYKTAKNYKHILHPPTHQHTCTHTYTHMLNKYLSPVYTSFLFLKSSSFGFPAHQSSCHRLPSRLSRRMIASGICAGSDSAVLHQDSFWSLSDHHRKWYWHVPVHTQLHLRPHVQWRGPESCPERHQLHRKRRVVVYTTHQSQVDRRTTLHPLWAGSLVCVVTG